MQLLTAFYGPVIIQMQCITYFTALSCVV